MPAVGAFPPGAIPGAPKPADLTSFPPSAKELGFGEQEKTGGDRK